MQQRHCRGRCALYWPRIAPEPLEIIVVDDGSEDNPQALLTRDFSGVHYMRQKHTGVPGVARNRGALAAQGEFLAFLDADDAWQPEKLRRQLEFLRREPEVALVLTRCMTISQEGDRIPPPAIFLPEGYRLRLAEWLNHHFRRERAFLPIPVYMAYPAFYFRRFRRPG